MRDCDAAISLAGIAAPEFVGRQDVLGPLRQRILDGDRRRLLGDLDLRQPRGAARGIARLGHHGEDDLAMEQDFAVGENRIIAHGRAAVVDARNVGGGEDGDDARIFAHRVEIACDDATPGTLWRVARRDMQRAFGLAHVVDIDGAALHMKCRAVMGERQADRVGCDRS